MTDTSQRSHVARANLHDLQFAPDADATRPLADGEARLRVDRFALTANNITYAAFGETMKYWQFFPCADASRGCIPVWGFASVIESRSAGVSPGQRVYGYFPLGTHLVVQPVRPAPHGFADGAAHRAGLAAIYNQYVLSDSNASARTEGLLALLKPLFSTSFLLDDFFADRGDFRAERLLLSSASSKTAYGTAFCLRRRATRPAVLGLTSAGNLDFVRSLGCYDDVIVYDDLTRLDPKVPSAYIDFAGDAALRGRVHQHLADALTYSCAVGGSHWEQLGGGGGLPGPRPELFFAPAQAAKRSAAPPVGWGAAALNQRIGDALAAFLHAIDAADPPWVDLRSSHGAEAVDAAYRRLLAGHVPAREGLVLAL